MMSSTKSTAKPRIQRLRASCDGCFLAKVKCSKARPICSRCLTCGTDCKYSPSSRAGKPKAIKANITPDSSIDIVSPDMIESALSLPFFFDYNAITMAADGKNTPIFAFGANWSIRCGSADNSYPGSLSTATAPLLGGSSMLDAEMGLSSSTGELFDPSFTWIPTSGNDARHSIYQVDPALKFSYPASTNDAPQIGSFWPWLDGHQSTHFAPPMNNNSPRNTFDSPCSSPDFAGPSITPASPCSCLKTCLQTLLALHDHSNPSKTQPAFDVVLTISQKAVEGCVSMLACGSCASRSSSTNSMLLATIMEKILSFYQEASRDYSGPVPAVESSIHPGTYQVTNEDGCWLKAEILWRELLKLEELLGHFRNVCGGRNGSEDTGVHFSLVNHLSQSLNFTFEVMKLQQTEFAGLQ